MQGIWKSTFREIKASFGRFMAIFAIIALGVGFFAGLKVTKAGMVETVTRYLDEHAFYDYRLLSTLGFEQEDVDSFAAAADVEAAEGGISFDILYSTEGGRQGAVKTYSVTEQVNTLKLVAGRMPQDDGECVVDSLWFGKSDIGSIIYLSEDNAEEDLEHFTHREYTIVGIVQSPLYIQFERGNTTLGTGRIDAFVYLLPEGYDTDYYTEVYVRFAQNYGLYSDDYDNFIDGKETLWEKLASDAAEARYLRILGEAEEKLAEARAELDTKRAEGETELADAHTQLEEGEQALSDARAELEEGETTLAEKEKELRDAKALVAKNKAELDSAEATISQKEAELAQGQIQIDASEVQLRSGERQLADGKAEWRSGSATVTVMKMALEQVRQELSSQRANLANQRAELDKRLEEGTITEDSPEYAVEMAYIEGIEARIAEYEARIAPMEAEISTQEQQLAAAWQQILISEQELNNGWTALAAAKRQVSEGQSALTEARREVTEGRVSLEAAQKEISEGDKALADARKELEEARETLAQKEEELAEGKQEYEDAQKEFNEKIAEAEAELTEAQEELEKLEEPDTYVLGRNTNVGYVCFESDSSIVEGIANIFPVFFFLVAALVCITTMNRMVEEQRTQIGVLKALGYGDLAIMMKYLTYSGLAALTGCVFGFFVGTWGFPKVIWFCYGLMYRADSISYLFDGGMAVISLVVSLLCSIGTTWLSCRVELSQVAAALMRPKAPKAGKRVFLERIPFIWKRLSFLRKVSMRNIFRYKKRLFMMIVGISGCTALLVTGFGIKDSIAGVATKQFTEIQTFDVGLALKEDADEKLRESLDGMQPQGLSEYTCVMEKNMDIVTDNGIKSIYLVTGTEEGMAPFLNLHTTGGKEIAYPTLGEAVISNKLAEDYHVNVGDMITLRDEEMRVLTATVTGIYENYLYNYVHVSEDTWRSQMEEDPIRKTVYLNFTEDALAGEGSGGLSLHEFSAELMKLDNVASVTVNADTMERVDTMMASLDIIVAVVIFCAAGLAFIVLYNLTNINITERIREIATIKVLGFYKKETSAYVFRENTMLTALGMAVGLVLGHFLHIFVMNEIKIDMIAFYIHVKPISFVYSALLTFGFAWLVDLFMGGKLERVSMTESLKSVD